ncbi:hypothetical protein [Scytonema sp. PCC 10023]|uniref:hypothetical protein n=1 Tax=Scytonema sp. PCC 10023 TaxID=1680591 RepID=UPI0039C64ACD
MSVPIVLIHRTDSDYLLYSLSQAKKVNPQSNIHLIGDPSNSHYAFVKHYNILDYFQEAQEFSEYYQHLNTNPYEYEIFCFQRWLVLKNFMLINKIEKCFYMDSDVMLYADMTLEEKRFSRFDFTLSYPPQADSPSPHCSFINNINALNDFCDFLKEIYLNDSLLNIMKLQFDRCAGHGGACDMTAFREYQNRGRSKIGNTSIILNDSIYDHNINDSHGFEMCNGIKNINLRNGKPFCRYSDCNKEIKFKILHFQGGAKKFMRYYCTARKAIIADYFRKLRGKVYRLIVKLEKIF